MAKKLGDFFRNTMGVPAGKQPIEKELTKPAKIAFEPPPVLTMPAKIPFEPAPALISPAKLPELGSQTPQLSSPASLPEQLAPTLISPTAPETQNPPKLTMPTAPVFQEPPLLTSPSVMVFQKAPKLTNPTPPKTQSPPVLTQPTAPVFQGPPVLTQPTAPVFQGPPNLVQPTPPIFQGPPNLLQPTPPIFQAPPDLLQPTPPVFEPPPNLLQPTPPVFQPPPAASVPAQIPFEPPPNLLLPTAPGFQDPPALTLPTTPSTQAPPALTLPTAPVFQGPPNLTLPTPPGTQAPPNLIQPAPIVPTSEQTPSEVKTGFEAMLARQVEYFKKTLPASLNNLKQRATPMPGNINPEFLPSTIFTKALNVANETIRNLENTYGYNPVNNAGAAVSSFLGSAMGVNYSPPGSYENSNEAASLGLINKDLIKFPEKSKAFLFNPDTKQLYKTYKSNLKGDQKYGHFLKDKTNPRYRLEFDDQETGLLTKGVKINEASKRSYFPFYFVDLRPDTTNKYRTVFFQPFNLELSERFAPNWNAQNFMGRVDPVATYQNTTRNISISFKMVAIHPSDLEVIYGKLKWLTSMVYPEYSPNMRYKSGPIVKMRVGDIINASSPSVPLSNERPGVSGYITSLDFNYDKMWELEDNWQVPRAIDVSLSFTVLHELPIGIVDGDFGGVGQIVQKKDNNVFMSPQAMLQEARGAGAEFGTGENDPRASAYVTERSFRSVGPEKPPPEPPTNYGE